MKTRYLIAVGAVVLSAVGMTLAQPPKVGPSPPPTDSPTPLAHPAQLSHMPPQPVLQTRAVDKPEDMTIEQLLDAVERFREQRAELEKKEKAYMKVVHQKAGKLKERIDGIDGVTAPTLPPPINTTSAPGIPARGGAPPGLVPAVGVPPGVVPTSPLPSGP